MKNFDKKKYKLLVKIGMPILALLLILLFVFFPVKFLNTALDKEAEEKEREVERVIDLDLIEGI